jgi:hypothetical protein
VLQGGGEPDGTYQLLSEKSQADGYASLNIDGFVPNAEFDPGEVFLKKQNNHRFGDATAAVQSHCFDHSASGEVCVEYSAGVVKVLGQIQATGGFVSLDTAFPLPTGFLEQRMVRLGDQFGTDQANLGVWPGPYAREILKLECTTTGTSSTVTGTLTRNGVDITTAPLVCDTNRQSSCGTTYGTAFGACDVQTLDAAEIIFEPGDEIGFNYISDANSPETLSFGIVWREVAVP